MFVLLNVTLERLLGSWLERLLSRRRTREIFLGLFVLSMVSLQFLTPLLNRYGAVIRPVFLRLLPYFAWFPPSLAGRALAAVIQLQPARFLLSAAAFLLYLAVLSALLWRRFAAQYHGEELSETAAPSRAVVRPMARKVEAAFAASGRRPAKGIPLSHSQWLCVSLPALASDAGSSLQLPVCGEASYGIGQGSFR
jgi:hypothetical protein